MKQVEISVIIPVYNTAEYLPDCLASVLRNDMKEMEIILIDDGSTDRSSEICDDFARQDGRIRVIHQGNAGVSATRNRGICAAEGKYIAFVDSDDMVDSNYFRTLHQEAENGADLAVCPWFQDMRVPLPEAFTLNLREGGAEKPRLFLDLYRNYYLTVPVNKLLLRTIAERHQIRFPENTSYGEDLLFMSEYLKHTERLAYTAATSYHYINREGSLSHVFRADRFANGLRLNLALLDVFAYTGCTTGDSDRFIYRRIFDDAYNAIFERMNAGDQAGGMDQIRVIVSNSYVQKAMRIAELGDYPAWIRTLMRMKQVRLLYFFSGRRKNT